MFKHLFYAIIILHYNMNTFFSIHSFSLSLSFSLVICDSIMSIWLLFCVCVVNIMLTGLCGSCLSHFLWCDCVLYGFENSLRKQNKKKTTIKQLIYIILYHSNFVALLHQIPFEPTLIEHKEMNGVNLFSIFIRFHLDDVKCNGSVSMFHDIDNNEKPLSIWCDSVCVTITRDSSILMNNYIKLCHGTCKNAPKWPVSIKSNKCFEIWFDLKLKWHSNKRHMKICSIFIRYEI